MGRELHARRPLVGVFSPAPFPLGRRSHAVAKLLGKGPLQRARTLSPGGSEISDPVAGEGSASAATGLGLSTHTLSDCVTICH